MSTLDYINRKYAEGVTSDGWRRSAVVFSQHSSVLL